ncbi:CRISPR-associated protein Cas4 [Clostridium novyi]|nr:CRISPR-associated protein Cas4 [Clostridium novyi]
MESNSEDVKIGKAIHKIKEERSKNTEVAIENIKIDKITKEYLVEVKKSDSDIEAVRWQVLFYLKVLKDKGINKKGKIEVVEKKKSNNKIIYEELTDEKEEQLKNIISDIEKLIESENPPKVEFDNKCKKCAYYEYCYI